MCTLPKRLFLNIQRYIGESYENYSIIAFADACEEILGCIIYSQNTVTNEIDFTFAKSKK